MLEKSPSRGGLRPTSAPRVAQTLEGDATVKGHPNPFKAEHVQYLQERRKGGATAKRTATRAPSVAAKLRQRQREQAVLQSLERLEHKHTVERAVRELEEVLAAASPEELHRFLRTAFDPKRPPVTCKARQSLLLLLRAVVRRFHALGDLTVATAALKERILPVLVDALKSPEQKEVVVITLHDILDCHVPEEAPEQAKKGFLQAGRGILKALLDPLALGMGWDSEVKRRCVAVLKAITPELLRRARQCQAGGDVVPDSQVQDLLETYGQLLMHSLEVSTDLHEALLQCLLQLCHDEACQKLQLRAKELTELCAGHLLDTPSPQPLYVPSKEVRPESPARGALSRGLALACCQLLQRLPAMQVEEDLRLLRPQVLRALDRENLNLQRLCRGHELLRSSIQQAKQAWEALPARTSSAHRHRAAVKSAMELEEGLDARRVSDVTGERAVGEEGAESADGELAAEDTAPTMHPTELDAEMELANAPGSRRSTSWYLQDRPEPQKEVIRLENELMTSAGPVPRWEPPCGAGRMPLAGHPADAVRRTADAATEAGRMLLAGHPADAVRRTADAATEAGRMPLTGHWADDARTADAATEAGLERRTADAATEITPREEKLIASRDAGGSERTPAVAVAEGAPAACQARQARQAPRCEAMERPGFLAEVIPSRALNSEDCPLLSGILDYLAAGRVDLAMQCIFSLGNEQTLRVVLQRLESDRVWEQLPKPEALHLARLLVALLCRDPFSPGAAEACPWLESLVRVKGDGMLQEELSQLQGALFSLSGAGGGLGPCAARLYFRLFQQAVPMAGGFGRTPFPALACF